MIFFYERVVIFILGPFITDKKDVYIEQIIC